MKIWNLFRQSRSHAPSPLRGTSCEIRDFSAASFTWANGSDLTLQFTVQLSCMRLEGGMALVELRVVDHGLQIISVLEGNRNNATLYLGNYFIVPQDLRRRGLGSAVLLASLRTFQHAAFGQALCDQLVRLEGTFVEDGAAFACSMCHGTRPTKAAPAPLDLQRLERSAGQLQMDQAPRLLD